MPIMNSDIDACFVLVFSSLISGSAHATIIETRTIHANAAQRIEAGASLVTRALRRLGLTHTSHLPQRLLRPRPALPPYTARTRFYHPDNPPGFLARLDPANRGSRGVLRYIGVMARPKISLQRFHRPVEGSVLSCTHRQRRRRVRRG